mmetsp:Transcript_19337/g.40651  ORF Transcript_19337/g.40651 Transcript_19337/m.40651 type:complete len:919 (+) Transcript_19337:83-2839(+)
MAGDAAAEEAKLDFAHGHLAGQTGLAFALESAAEGKVEGAGAKVTQANLITGGADCLACLRTEESGYKETETDINDHEEVITCLAANRVAASGGPGAKAATDLFATGSEDRFVKVYSYPDAVFETNATRFELPVRAVEFSPCGRLLACAGDDEGVRLVRIEKAEDGSGDGETVKSCQLEKTLRTAGRSVKSLRWDPEGQFLAAISADGTLQIWNTKSGESVLTRRQVAHKFDASSPHCGHASWHPEGIFLAVSGAGGDCAFLERLSWEEESSLSSSADGEPKGHKGPLTCVEMSPNGLYAATAALDSRVVVWRVKDQKPIAWRQTEAVVSNIRWHPAQNALSLTDEEGNFAHWKDPVDAKAFPEPFLVGEEAAEAAVAQGQPGKGDNGAAPGGEDLAGLKKRKKGGGRIVESDSEDSGESGEDDGRFGGPAAHASDAAGRHGAGSRAPLPLAAADLPQMQAAVQPGATPRMAGSQRRFLAYNMDGYISTTRGTDFNSIEVVFHDISARSSRIPTLTDYYGFELGALGTRGTVLASPEKGQESPSVLMYRPFESWAAGTEWTCTFPQGEEVKAVTVGTTFAAAATNQHLRVYTLAGNPQAVLALPGQVVALAANESWLALIYHDGEPTRAGGSDNGTQEEAQHAATYTQKLAFALYDVSSEAQVAQGAVPLSAGAELEWVGFSEDGILATCDDQGCIRGFFFEAFGGSWTPLFNSRDARKAETEHHYVVGLSQREVFCIITKSARHVPQVEPRPIISTMPLAIPIVADGPAALQDEYLQSKLRQSAGIEMQLQMDRSLLKLIQAAIKGDQLEKALELAAVLNFQKSLEGALKLANAMRKRVLAEKIGELVVSRSAAEAAMMGPGADAGAGKYGKADHLSGSLGKENQQANVFSRKRAAAAATASDMPAPKTPKNPFART